MQYQTRPLWNKPWAHFFMRVAKSGSVLVKNDAATFGDVCQGERGVAGRVGDVLAMKNGFMTGAVLDIDGGGVL
jgi:hypothetical protein